MSIPIITNIVKMLNDAKYVKLYISVEKEVTILCDMKTIINNFSIGMLSNDFLILYNE